MCKKDNESKLTKEGIFAINTDYYEKLQSIDSDMYLEIKMPYEEEKKVTKTRKGRQKLVVGKNDLASQCPKAAEMWSSKNKLAPTEVFAGSGKKAFFVCQNCGREFFTIIQNVVRAITFIFAMITSGLYLLL